MSLTSIFTCKSPNLVEELKKLPQHTKMLSFEKLTPIPKELYQFLFHMAISDYQKALVDPEYVGKYAFSLKQESGAYLPYINHSDLEKQGLYLQYQPPKVTTLMDYFPGHKTSTEVSFVDSNGGKILEAQGIALTKYPADWLATYPKEAKSMNIETSGLAMVIVDGTRYLICPNCDICISRPLRPEIIPHVAKIHALKHPDCPMVKTRKLVPGTVPAEVMKKVGVVSDPSYGLMEGENSNAGYLDWGPEDDVDDESKPVPTKKVEIKPQPREKVPEDAIDDQPIKLDACRKMFSKQPRWVTETS